MDADELLAKQSIDKLFAEPFKPAWQKTLERSELEALDMELVTRTEFQYRQRAYKKLQHIAERHPPKTHTHHAQQQ